MRREGNIRAQVLPRVSSVEKMVRFSVIGWGYVLCGKSGVYGPDMQNPFRAIKHGNQLSRLLHLTVFCFNFLLTVIVSPFCASAEVGVSGLTLSVQRQPGYVLNGTLFEVAGDKRDAPVFSIGIQSVVQTGMPSYSELLTIYVRHDLTPVWRDLGQPFGKGNFVWLVALKNELIAIDRQEVAHPRKLILHEKPEWREMTSWELDQLERYLGRSESALRRPRMRGGPYTIQVVRPGTLEICHRHQTSAKSCGEQAMPLENDIVYTVADDGTHVILFTNKGWFRLNNDGSITPAWLQADHPWQSNQVYTALRTGRGILLGHYPSGNLLRLAVWRGHISARSIFGGPPYTAPARRTDRELQSLAYYGGRFLAGVWPWGELYEFREGSGWRAMRRVFKAPAISDALAPYADAILPSTAHPHLASRFLSRMYSILPDWAQLGRGRDSPNSAQLDRDVWGQRVTQLVPLGRSLYLATGNKSGEYNSKWLAFLPSPAVAGEYGRVYEITSPGNLACNLPAAENPLTLEISVVAQTLEVRVGGKLLCALADLTVELAKKSLRMPGTQGNGMYGALIGGHIKEFRRIHETLPAEATRPAQFAQRKTRDQRVSQDIGPDRRSVSRRRIQSIN